MAEGNGKRKIQVSAGRRRDRALALVGEQGIARRNRQGVEQGRERGVGYRPGRFAEQRGKRALGAKDACGLNHDGLILPLFVMDAFLAITDGGWDYKVGDVSLPRLKMNVRLSRSLQNQRSGLVARTSKLQKLSSSNADVFPSASSCYGGCTPEAFVPAGFAFCPGRPTCVQLPPNLLGRKR